MVLLEAAACGRATVGTEVGLMEDLCPKDMLARPGDIEGLAAILKAASADVHATQKLARHQQQLVADRFNVEVTVEEYLAAYRSQIN